MVSNDSHFISPDLPSSPADSSLWMFFTDTSDLPRPIRMLTASPQNLISHPLVFLSLKRPTFQPGFPNPTSKHHPCFHTSCPIPANPGGSVSRIPPALALSSPHYHCFFQPPSISHFLMTVASWFSFSSPNTHHTEVRADFLKHK